MLLGRSREPEVILSVGDDGGYLFFFPRDHLVLAHPAVQISPTNITLRSEDGHTSVRLLIDDLDRPKIRLTEDRRTVWSAP